MSLSQKAIEEFKKIAKKEYGRELTDVEANEQAHSLMRFVEILYECANKDF